MLTDCRLSNAFKLVEEKYHHIETDIAELVNQHVPW